MIWNLCIRRPVLTVVIFLIVAIFGMYAYFRMPVRENPDIDYPIVSINVVLPGAEPEVIETEIIEPLEEQVNTIEGLKQLSSTAREEVAAVTAEFELWRDIDVAAQDVRDRVDRARRDLPDGIEAPIVRKLDPDAQPIMWIALSGDRRWDAVRLTEYADEQLKERLENLRGVGQILIGGERLYAVRIRLDADRLAAHRITVQDVVDTIRRNNLKIPSGRVESRQREFLVKTQGQFSEPEPFNDLIVSVDQGRPVRIRDVGQAVDGVENDRQLARFKGQLAVGLGVVKQRDANTVAIADRVRERLEMVARDFPPGLEYTIATDDSVYIEQSVADLVRTVLLATCLVALVVLAFLRSPRGTIVSAMSIPTSLLGGLALIYVLGFSLNVLSLMGLILAIGIVVDDAVVVLESSYRHLERGEERKQAVRVGTAEVAFPNIANTLSLAAVFIPVAFTAGLIGRFFFEFALTVALTVVISTFTALTLTPMLCSRFLRVPKKSGKMRRRSERFFGKFQTAYTWLLDRAFGHKLLTIITAILVFAAAAFLFTRLSTEFMPPVDRSEFIVRFETPEGATIRHSAEFARRVDEVVRAVPEVNRRFYAVGLPRGAGPGKVNEGIMFVHLVPRGSRDRRQVDIVQDLRTRLAELSGGRAYVTESATSIGGRGAELQIVLQHDGLDELAAEQDRVMDWMNAQPEYLGVNSNLKMNKPQVQVFVNRDKASQMGVSVAEIANTMRYLLGEPDIAEIERANERYEVITEVIGKGRMVPPDLADLYVRNAEGELVAMDNLVRFEESIGPSEIHHFNRLRSATISASNPPGVPLGVALARLEEHFGQELSPEFEYTVTGRSQDFRESFYYLKIALIFSVVFVYLVLAAQFESFLHPLVILVTLPLAGVGAFAALWALDMTLNVFSFIGLVMLVGMATKNAILMIDYANRLTAEGREIDEAVRQAASVRFRPVIMTTISTVLGLLPIALGYGAGGESRAPLGVAVSAGLLATTGLTLLIIPVVYSLVGHARRGTLEKVGRVQSTQADEERPASPAEAETQA